MAVQLDPAELERRAEVARRLKAARWLAGSVEASRTGKTGHAVAELTQVKLAEHPNLRDNEITASLIGAIERMERPPRPMELEQIALALGQPANYFRADTTSVAPASTDELVEAVLRRLGVLEALEPPGRIRRLAEAEPTTGEGRQGGSRHPAAGSQ